MTPTKLSLGPAQSPSQRLVLVRHGQTDWNAQKRLQGRSDIPLNAVGVAQAFESARALALKPWDVLVSSPLVRALDTARIIAEHTRLEPLVVPGLVERDCGNYEGQYVGGLTEAEISDLYGSGETEDEVARRGSAVLGKLLADYPQRRIVAVAHGTLIRATLSLLRGRPYPIVGNGRIIELEPECMRVLVHDGSAAFPDARCPLGR